MRAASRATRFIALLALVASLYGCGGASSDGEVTLTDAPSTPASTTPGPATPAPASPDTPTPGGGPTAAPASVVPPVLTAQWVAPEPDATLGRSRVTLSSRPTPDTNVVRVVYRVAWVDGDKRACVAKLADNGKWACRADLLALGVPPGPVAFDFDVVLTDGAVVESPAGGRDSTYGVAPPKPADTSFKLIGSEPGGEPGTTVVSWRARWSSPEGYADEFLVYGTTTCPRESAKNDGTPCVVPGMKINMADLELLNTAPGDARSMKVQWTEGELGGPDRSFLLRASNQYGNSAFAILSSADVCWMCVY